MARLQSDLILTLQDRVSGPVRQIDRNLENLRNQQMRSQQLFDHHRNAMATTAVAAYVLAQSLAAPVQAASAFDSAMFQIGLKADLSVEKVKALGAEILALGRVTGQGAGNQVALVDQLMGKGLDEDVSTQAAEQIGYAASAYTASGVDLANAVGSLLLNGGFSAEQVSLALDIMSKSGKLGQVELRDMAAEFPALTAAAQTLGITGVEGLIAMVSWLQIAREGTATASEAATNLSDFMMKLQAPDVIENFSNFGVDLTDELARAKAEGIDPIEHVLGIINRLTENGAKGDIIGQLFGEKNSLMFLQTALPKIERVLAWQEELQASQGTVATDFQKWKESPAGSFANFFSTVENLNVIVGQKLVPELARFADAVTPMIDGVASFVAANGELVAAVVEITAALIGLRLLAAAGGMGGALMGLGGAAPGGAPGSAPGGRTGGKGLPWWGFLGFNGIQMAQDYLAAGEGMTVRPAGMSDADWAAQTKPGTDAKAAREAAQEAWLKDLNIGGFKPFAALDQAAHPTGGIGGGYTGPSQGQIDAMKAEIASVDSEIANWGPDQALEERRSSLSAKLVEMEAEFAASGVNAGTGMGQGMGQGLAAQLPALDANMRYIMDNLALVSAVGVEIPVRLAPGNLNPGSVAPPSRSAGVAAPASTTITNHVGPTTVTVNANTNANPQQIARAVGQEIGKQVRGAYMDVA